MPMRNKKTPGIVIAAMIGAALAITGCQGQDLKEAPIQGAEKGPATAEAAMPGPEEDEAEDRSEAVYDNSESGGHAIEADGIDVSYSKASVTKTGDSEGDEADFYGENAAVFATNGAHLTLSEMNIKTDGEHANAVFSYGEGTIVDITDSNIETSGNCSGGIMTTGGGTMNASNLTIHTTGRSSAAIRSDRGGGKVTVNGGNYITDGTGSPAIYSTADITVNDASLTSTASQGVVVEGKNSVTLNNVVLNADNNQHNSDKSDHYQAVMIYQSMSGDADMGLSEFNATGGGISNANGDVFFVNNTATSVNLTGVDITNNGGGVFLRAAAAGWGNEGSNGGKVNLNATDQKIDGDMIVDDISVLNLYLKEGSVFSGAVNPDGAAGAVYVDLSGGAKWTLTADSYISSLTCDADSIDLNGYTLTVDGKKYSPQSASNGEPVEIKPEEGAGRDKMQADDNKKPPMEDGNMQPPQDGERPEMPDGQRPQKPDGEPPQKPDGEGGPAGREGTPPPDMPD